MLLLLLVGSAFVVAGWLMLPTRPIVASLAIAFFGLGTARL